MQFPKPKLLILIVYVSGLSLSMVGYATTSINLPKEHILNFANHSNLVRHGKPLTPSHQAAFYGALGSAIIFAAMPATLTAPWFMNRFGRKFVLCFIHAPLNVLASGVMLMAKFVNSYELLLIGRVLVGLSTGFAFPPMAVYASECSPGKFRGFLGSVPIVMLTIGTVISTVINAPFSLGTETLWIFGQSVPPLFMSLTLICSYRCFPESPKYSLQRGNVQVAKYMISRYHGVEAAEESLSEMRRELVNTKVKGKGFLGAFQDRATRRAIFLGFVANTTVSTSGLVALQVYSGTALRAAGIEDERTIPIVIGLQVLVVLATAIGALVTQKLNRRAALLGSIGLCAVLVVDISVIAFVQQNNNDDYLEMIHVIIKAKLFAVSSTGQSISIFLPSELSPTPDRPLVSSLSLLGWYIAGVVTVQLFPILTEEIGSGFTYLSLFAAPLVMAGIFLYLKLPETKARHVDEVVAELGGKRVNEEAIEINDTVDPTNDDVTNDDANGPEVSMNEQFQMREKTTTRPKEQVQMQEKETSGPEEQFQMHEKETTSIKDQFQMQEKETSGPEEQFQMHEKETSSPKEQFQMQEKVASGPEEQFQMHEKETTSPKQEFQMQEKETSGPEKQFQMQEKVTSGGPEEQFQMHKKETSSPKQEFQMQKNGTIMPGEQLEMQENQTTTPRKYKSS